MKKKIVGGNISRSSRSTKAPTRRAIPTGARVASTGVSNLGVSVSRMGALLISLSSGQGFACDQTQRPADLNLNVVEIANSTKHPNARHRIEHRMSQSGVNLPL